MIIRSKRVWKATWRFIVAVTNFILVPARFPCAEEGYDVALTSHGGRILIAGIAIASFCQGASYIRHIYLTIDSEERITPSVRLAFWLLRRKGIRLIFGSRRGPHSKYWYFLHNVWNGERPFILIDDDVIYARGLADVLFQGASQCEYNACVRSLNFGKFNGRPTPYRIWRICEQAVSGYEVFATNVGGVVIKPSFARKLKELGESYMEHCRSNDDIWFHWVAVRHRMPYTQLLSEFVNPPPIPGTQAGGLTATVNSTGNDFTIAKQYSQADLMLLE
jgi:hypothetical protein